MDKSIRVGGSIMKRMITILSAILICAALFSGCVVSSESHREPALAVYSFSGENDVISVSNGVLVTSAAEQICYGGDLSIKQDVFDDITAYSTTICVYSDDGSADVLLSNGVADKTGGTIGVSGEIGKVSGAIFQADEIGRLIDNLWFELRTTDINGEENTYQIQLDVTAITEEHAY